MRLTGPSRAPLRDLTDAERAHLQATVRATSERADVRQRAVALLAVAEGQSYEAAAGRAGFAHGTAVSRLIRRVNAHGPAALEIAAGPGRQPTHSVADRQQILDTLQESPQRTTHPNAAWSL